MNKKTKILQSILLSMILILEVSMPVLASASSQTSMPNMTKTPYVDSKLSTEEGKNATEADGKSSTDVNKDNIDEEVHEPQNSQVKEKDAQAVVSAPSALFADSIGIYIVNGDDINDVSFDTFSDACNAINQASGVTYTITVTDNVDLGGVAGIIDAGKEVTLTSGQDGPFILSQNNSSGSNVRHAEVKGKLTLKNITLDGSRTSGGISVESGELYMDNSTIQNCYTTGPGAGISLNNSNFVMQSGVIAENHSAFTYGNSGGGVFLGSNVTFTMEGGSIKNNSATWGGGVEVGEDCTFTMEGGEITGNKTNLDNNGYGGGVHVYAKGKLHLKNGTISENGSLIGAGIFVGQGTTVQKKLQAYLLLMVVV